MPKCGYEEIRTDVLGIGYRKVSTPSDAYHKTFVPQPKRRAGCDAIPLERPGLRFFGFFRARALFMATSLWLCGSAQESFVSPSVSNPLIRYRVRPSYDFQPLVPHAVYDRWQFPALFAELMLVDR